MRVLRQPSTESGGSLDDSERYDEAFGASPLSFAGLGVVVVGCSGTRLIAEFPPMAVVVERHEESFDRWLPACLAS